MGRKFDLLLPKANDAGPGVVFTESPKNYMRRAGTLNELMWAIEPQGSESQASNDGKRSLCGLGPWTNAETLAEGSPEMIAPRVRCRWCQARLVNAGVIDPDEAWVTAYAKDYGTRPPA
jgi:hypothetical protein